MSSRWTAPSKKVFRFPNSGDDAFGVGRLFGCTSVIIISSRGVFLSHIWEVPTFVDARGVDQNSDSSLLPIFKFFEGDTDRLGFEVLKRPFEVLSQQYGPEVFVITPYTTRQDRKNGVHTNFRYQEQITRLAQWLYTHFPNGMPRIVGYTRRDQSDVPLPDQGWNGRYHAKPEWKGIGGRAMVEVNMNGTNVICTDGTRVLPDICLREWRLWVEDQVVDSRRFILNEK
ncbi:MAG: hypothetical protein Q9165_004417 [Trypethelium subeluteriae]